MEENQEKEATWYDKLISMRQDWTSRIKELCEMMTDLQGVDRAMNNIYSTRQDAVDLQFSMASLLKKHLLSYKAKHAKLFNEVKSGKTGIRYTSDSSINEQVESLLTNEKEVIDALQTFIDFMKESVSTIDGLMYAVKDKLRAYELLHDLKF